MVTKSNYTKEAHSYWNEQYDYQGYKVVHNAGTEEKTFNLADREIDFFLWPSQEKSDSLMNDKENNPYPTFDKNFASQHKSISNYFERLNDKIALDYGCGILGRYTFALAKHFKMVYGIDIASNAIEGCNAKKIELDSKNTSFQVNDGITIRLPNNFVDFIFSNLVLQHIGYKEGIFAILKEFSRILKSGGIMRLEFLDSSQNRPDGFFSVVEGCGMNVVEIRDKVKKCGISIESYSEEHPYLWLTMKKN